MPSAAAVLRRKCVCILNVKGEREGGREGGCRRRTLAPAAKMQDVCMYYQHNRREGGRGGRATMVAAALQLGKKRIYKQ